MSDEFLKCRFCGWKTLKYRTRKDGVRVPGWGRLMEHVEVDHPDQATAVSEELGTEYLGEINDDWTAP